MEEKLYQVVGIPYEELNNTKKSPIFKTGAIRGEVDANNVRKTLSTSHPNCYWKMTETSIEEVGFYMDTKAVDALITKSAIR